MPESKKAIFNKADFLTEVKFAKKYSISKELVILAVSALYKQNKQFNSPAGNLTPVVTKNRLSHSGNSRYLIHPLAHDFVLKEVENQKKLLAKQAKGIEK